MRILNLSWRSSSSLGFSNSVAVSLRLSRSLYFPYKMPSPQGFRCELARTRRPRLLGRSPRIARSPASSRQRPPVPLGSPPLGLSGGGPLVDFLRLRGNVIGSGFALAGTAATVVFGAGSAAYASVGSGARQSGHQGYTPYIAPLFRQQPRSAVGLPQRQRALGAPVHPV